MNAKTIGRRMFSRVAATTPVALGVGLQQAGLAPPDPGPFHNMAQAGSSPMTGGKRADTLADQVWKLFRKATKADRDNHDLRRIRRDLMGSRLDPDLAVLNSMSLQRRVQIQMDRERAFSESQNSVYDRFAKQLGVDIPPRIGDYD